MSSWRINSGMGSVLWELGIFGAIVPIGLILVVRQYFGSISSDEAINAAVGLFLVLLSGIPIGFPIIGLIWGLLAGGLVDRLHKAGAGSRKNQAAGSRTALARPSLRPTREQLTQQRQCIFVAAGLKTLGWRNLPPQKWKSGAPTAFLKLPGRLRLSHANHDKVCVRWESSASDQDSKHPSNGPRACCVGSATLPRQHHTETSEVFKQ